MNMPKQLYIDLIRSDMSDWLFHCTTSFDALKTILSQQLLEGSKDKIRGGYTCVCFSDAPLVKIKALTRFAKAYSQVIGHKLRYAPFGVAVKKSWLFELGGRPVIYQRDDEYDLLSEPQRYLHVSYNPNSGNDFTWEREWRVHIDSLRLNPENCTVFVESRCELDELLGEFYGGQWGEHLAYCGVNIFPWGLVSLDEIC
jgi:hypothetical protein